MTEKRVVTLNILLEGTGNNRREDLERGQESNVARIGSVLKADYKFDVSEGLRGNPAFASTLEEMGDDKIGNRDALTQLIYNDTSSCTINAYYDGVGSHQDDNLLVRKIEGGTGAGMSRRVGYFVKVIKEFHDVDLNVEIRINVIAGSRGAGEAKDMLNKLDSQDHSYISVNKVVPLDTVIASGNPKTPAHSGMEADYSSSLMPHPENVLEIVSLNETRGSFPSTTYQQDGVKTLFLPGAHAQQIGGYANDLLSYATFAAALNHLSEDTPTSEPVALEQLTPEQTASIAFSHIILGNAYLTRSFLIDSRVMIEDALNPGDNIFYGESPQDGFFDRATEPRLIIDESRVNDDSELTAFIKDLFSGVTEMFQGERPDTVQRGGEELANTVYHGIETYNADGIAG